MKKIAALIFCFLAITIFVSTAYCLEQRIVPLTFLADNGTEQSSFRVIDSEPKYSKAVGIAGRENISYICNYDSAGEAITLYAQTYDTIGGAWIDIEGSAFLVDTLPVTTGSAGRIGRVAGLPALNTIRFKMLIDGDNATVAGFNLILE